MSFVNITYQSDFYNFHKKLISVKLYKDNFAGDVTHIRTIEVSIEVNYQDDITPVIGTGASVSFVNQGEFSDFDDLLTAYEKTWKCVIEYNNIIVFEGYNICDLNEQQMCSYGIIAVQFTNYLRRLEDLYLTQLVPISGKTSILDLIQEALIMTGNVYCYYINSTLWEEKMLLTESFLSQAYVQNSLFYSNNDEYDNAYTTLNKLLLSFGAVLYQYGNKWVIERIENIGRIGDWGKYMEDSSLYEDVDSLNQNINKQNGDFEYINNSQVLSYNSGIKTSKLNLQDKLLSTLVFNDFTNSNIIAIPLLFEYIVAGSWTSLFTYWLYEEHLTTLTIGQKYIGINQWISWVSGDNTVTWALRGLYHLFNVQFNIISEPTTLTVSYKQSCNVYDKTVIKSVLSRFYIKVNSGAKADYFVSEVNSGIYTLSLTPYIFEEEVMPSETGLMSITVNKDIKLNSTIQSDLGFPKIQDFIIAFLPTKYTTTADVVSYATYNIVGDIAITINATAINNEITTVLNENFTKTEDIDLDLFDVDNINYVNGLELSNGIKTNFWTSNEDSASEPLVNFFIRDRFRKYSKTAHILKANILYDGIIKPFCKLSDDNLLGDVSTGSILEFVISKYRWDLNPGIYQIEAEELPDTDIIINE
jgi:hypothetical protein